eukprot:5427103-Alexandrium_andersonii.AAC.1
MGTYGESTTGKAPGREAPDSDDSGPRTPGAWVKFASPPVRHPSPGFRDSGDGSASQGSLRQPEP